MALCALGDVLLERYEISHKIPPKNGGLSNFIKNGGGRGI